MKEDINFQTADKYNPKKKIVTSKNAVTKVTKNKVTKSLISLDEKDRSVLKLLVENPEGLRTPTIQKLSNLPSKTLYRHLNKMKKLEILEKVSTIWKICHFQANPLNVTKLLESNTKQIHDISFVVRGVKFPEWWEKRENNLRRLKEYQFKKDVNWGNNPYVQLMKDHFLIHAFKNTLIFINQKKYWGNDPYLAFVESLKDFLEALRYFEEKIKFKFFLDEVPQISVKSNHFVQLNDYLNKRCEKTGDQFQVMVNEELRCLVDMSDPKGTEFINKNYAIEDTQRYAKVVEDVIKNNPPTLSQLTSKLDKATDLIMKNTSNLDYHAENMKSHVGATIELKEATLELKEGISKQTIIMEKILEALSRK